MTDPPFNVDYDEQDPFALGRALGQAEAIHILFEEHVRTTCKLLERGWLAPDVVARLRNALALYNTMRRDD